MCFLYAFLTWRKFLFGLKAPKITLAQVKGVSSLRLLALILCSNCSNTFNKVFTPLGVTC